MLQRAWRGQATVQPQLQPLFARNRRMPVYSQTLDAMRKALISLTQTGSESRLTIGKNKLKSVYWSAICAALCLTDPVQSIAQVATAPGTQLLQQQGTIGPATPVPLSEQAGGRPSQTPATTGTNIVSRTLRDWSAHGYTVRIGYIQNVAANPIGGLRQGIESAQEVDAALDLDFGKIAGWQGTRAHIQVADFWGHSDARDFIGSSVSLQSTWRQVPGPRLSLLVLDQDLFDGRANILLGRAPVNSYFASSPVSCAFQSNATCLALYGPIVDVGITAFPNSSWAGKVQYNFTKNIYVQAGAFEYNPSLNTQGRDGLYFSTARATGVIAHESPHFL